MNLIKPFPRFRDHVLACLLLVCSGATAHAGNFAATTIAGDMIQSRDFDGFGSKELLQSCLAVLQDIKFQVTESELEPGLIVAQASPALISPTLSISLQPNGTGNSYQVRLSAAVHGPQPQAQPDFTDFYQGFFQQLQQELFELRNLR